MGVVGATVAGLAAANAIAGTIKNVAGAIKETGEVINNAYEGVKKVVKDFKGDKTDKPAHNNRRRKRGNENESKD